MDDESWAGVPHGPRRARSTRPTMRRRPSLVRTVGTVLMVCGAAMVVMGTWPVRLRLAGGGADPEVLLDALTPLCGLAMIAAVLVERRRTRTRRRALAARPRDGGPA